MGFGCHGVCHKVPVFTSSLWLVVLACASCSETLARMWLFRLQLVRLQSARGQVAHNQWEACLSVLQVVRLHCGIGVERVMHSSILESGTWKLGRAHWPPAKMVNLGA